MRFFLCFLFLFSLTLPAAAQSCSARLSFVTTLINKDLKTGFLSKSIHTKMTSELAAATAACEAGQDDKAQAMISTTQSRHGYPVR